MHQGWLFCFKHYIIKDGPSDFCLKGWSFVKVFGKYLETKVEIVSLS